MSNVFISYARPTAKQAQQVVEALRGLGYSVWIDDAIPAHRAYADVLDEELKAAAAVVVDEVGQRTVKSRNGLQSEADHARETGKLVQLNIDGARLPMPFDRIQCADMTSSGPAMPTLPGWLRVVSEHRPPDGRGGAGAGRGSPAAGPAETEHRGRFPFANLSNDPEQDYFVDGVVEEIVSALARFKSLLRHLHAGDNLVSEVRR